MAVPTMVLNQPNWPADYSDSNAGDDTVIGTAQNNTINGGNGNDILSGKVGNDTLLGGGGDDGLRGGVGNDHLAGDPGKDWLVGEPGDDTLRGGSGNDVLRGGTGNDVLEGSIGNDDLDGGIGHDILKGGTDGDYLNGGGGNDQLFGGTGGDLLSGGPGNDTIDGGDDIDTVENYGASASGVVLQINGSATGEGTDQLISIENVTGSKHNDVVIGDGGANKIEGGDGNDDLQGGAGDDQIFGDNGNDTLHGGNGSDVFHYVVDSNFPAKDATLVAGLDGNDKILDFSFAKHDQLSLSVFFDDATLSALDASGEVTVATVGADHADVTISFAGGGSILLENILTQKEESVDSLMEINEAAGYQAIKIDEKTLPEDEKEFIELPHDLFPFAYPGLLGDADPLYLLPPPPSWPDPPLL